jgi:hyperosmotically inducible protein
MTATMATTGTIGATATASHRTGTSVDGIDGAGSRDANHGGWIMPKSRSLPVIAALVVLVSACGSTPTQESTGEYFDDATITVKVKAALIEDKAVKAADIKVDTYRGDVQLSGFADNAAEVARAVELAQRVPGVRLVRNDITLKPTRP